MECYIPFYLFFKYSNHLLNINYVNYSSKLWHYFVGYHCIFCKLEIRKLFNAKKNTAKPQNHFNKKHVIFFCKINQLIILYRYSSWIFIKKLNNIYQYGVDFCVELTNWITSRTKLINELLCVIFFAIISNF